MSQLKLLILLISTSVLVISCGEEVPTSVPIQVLKEEPEKVALKENTKKYARLTDENCVEFLTEYGKANPQTKVKVTTKWGDFVIELFEDTPLHRANFLYMIERGYYCPTQVVRIIDDFVVQGGNSDEEMAALQRSLIGKYQIPQEITANHFHHKGAVAMSRSYEENPDKGSSAYDFYVVEGKMASENDILDARKKGSFNHTDYQLSVYKELGGAIHLDGEHTVFGKVLSGLRTIEILSELETDDSDWPHETVTFHMEVLD